MKTDSLRLYVVAVLALQAACTAILWVLNVLSVGSTQAFELLVAANLVGFAIVLQAYRNPDSMSRGDESKPATPPAAASAPSTTASETIHSRTPTPAKAALPPSVHIAIPIASIAVLLAFAVVLFLPTNKNALPPTSTVIYIPVYLVIVVILVFGSMYLFKRLMDAEAPAEP